MSNAIEITRRDLLLVGASGAFLLTPFANAEPPDPGSFAELMTALELLGDQLPLSSRAEQDAYIYKVAARAMLVDSFPTSKAGQIGGTGIEIRPLARTQPPTDVVHGIALISYRMAPNAILRPHNHPNYSVATIGIEGEALVTHYESDGSAPPFSSTSPFTVRRTAERLLRAREASTLSPSRDNIHTFRAGPAGARFVDLFSNHGGHVGFSYLDIDSKPTLAGGDVFSARWAPTPSGM